MLKKLGGANGKRRPATVSLHFIPRTQSAGVDRPMEEPTKGRLQSEQQNAENSAKNYYIRTVGLIVLVGLILSIRMHDESRLVQELQDSGHAILFGILAVALLRDRKAGFRAYLLVGIITGLIGAATEGMQWIEGRDAEVVDVLRDELGAVAFLVIAWILNHRVGSINRAALGTGATLILIAIFWPAAITAAALAYRWHEFPVIEDFSSRLEMRFCSVGDARLEVISEGDKHLGRITFLPAEYSGFAISGPFPNWRMYRKLAFAVESRQPETVRLWLRIHDRKHNDQYSDRYNSELEIHPGTNLVQIPLDVVESAPKDREMDLGAIQAIGLFLIRPKRCLDLCVRGFRLE